MKNGENPFMAYVETLAERAEVSIPRADGDYIGGAFPSPSFRISSHAAFASARKKIKKPKSASGKRQSA